METELLVPYGVDANRRLVSAAEAQRRIEYRCPQCDGLLILRAGDIKITHFAHKADTGCSGETLLHQIAKRLVAQVVNECATSSPNQPTISCTCKRCNHIFQSRMSPKAFGRAEIEKRVGPFVCDVVAFRNSEPVLAIEILATHLVEEGKARGLTLPWIELSAQAVIDAPYSWVPKNSRLEAVLCRDCKAHDHRLREAANRWNQPIPDHATDRDPSRATYLAAVERCYKCKNDIVVYWWAGVPFCENEPPKPRPSTIEHRFSKTYGGSYWANTCPACSALQGDNFLFLFEGAPFSGLPMRNLPQLEAQRAKASQKLIDIMFRNIGH